MTSCWICFTSIGTCGPPSNTPGQRSNLTSRAGLILLGMALTRRSCSNTTRTHHRFLSNHLLFRSNGCKITRNKQVNTTCSSPTICMKPSNHSLIMFSQTNARNLNSNFLKVKHSLLPSLQISLMMKTHR